MQKKKVCIIGAGYAGVHAAKLLHKYNKKQNNLEITLIDRHPFHTLMTDLHEVAGNRMPVEGVKVDLYQTFAKKSVDVVVDEVTSVDFETKKVVGEKGSYAYDYLLIGTGSKPTFFGIPGADEHALTLWSYEDAVEVKEHIIASFDKARTLTDVEEQKKLLTFCVAGAGFTGIEMIGELAEWVKALCRDYDLDRDLVDLKIIEAAPNICNILEEDLQQKAEKRLIKMNIEVMKNAMITEVGPESITINKERVIPTKTLIWTAGIESSEFSETVGLTTNHKKRLEANAYMQSVDHDDVFVIGDNGYYVEEGEKMAYPQIVEAALQTAETAVENVEKLIEGKSDLKPFKSDFHGFMVSIGSRYAVAHVGGMKLQGFFAMAVKHLVNLHYLWGVGGFQLIFTYLMHEFFHIKEKRSILGGHFAKRGHTFWSFPLRLFIGYKWLEQGLHKLPDIISDPNNIFLIPASPDAVSAASDAAGEWADVEALYVPEWIKGISDFFMDLMFYNPDGSFNGFAAFFQGFMIFAEIAIGLALIAGLFTVLASIGSIGISLMVWVSGMADPELIWYFFGSFPLIAGAGRALGLDYYVIPWLKEKWKHTAFARKSYLYID